MLAMVGCAITLNLRAANPGDEVIVVYNNRVPESRGVAEYYAERRQVPSSQLIGLPLSTNEPLEDSYQRIKESWEA